ncbi:PH domain-containing protein [Arthrobacter sp. ok362]|uniref:PH domain-containing protein n=1 Tax=Arthrobacter sp. ok362 TaxID=1761745 RepID=UPI000890390C|nr:PH domain-containing protein [Arthrobacter sp. ok362]SDM07771.1 PH domain-containing protein [Arthrobacter sp. ok362]
MTSAPETVLWTMLTGVDAARDHIRSAAVESGFRAASFDEDCINIEVPFSLRKRRRAARLTATVWPSARGAGVAWTADPGALNHEYLAHIEETLPEGVMYYHGLKDAALRAGLSLGGRTELRAVVRALARDETVRAIGKGHLNETAGYIVLTTRRLLVIEASGLGSRTLLDAPHGSIEALSLGKRITGETLRVALPPGPIVISRLGHGEGHGIVKSYREEKKDRARFVPSSVGHRSAPDPEIHDSEVTCD